ncbi:MAG: hypothetical protein WDN46_15810 [Methylocella sp.]
MTEKWFKFTSIGRKDLYGFGTIDEAVIFAEGHHTPYILSDPQVAELDLANRDDTFRIRDALGFIGRQPLPEGRQPLSQAGPAEISQNR